MSCSGSAVFSAFDVTLVATAVVAAGAATATAGVATAVDVATSEEITTEVVLEGAATELPFVRTGAG